MTENEEKLIWWTEQELLPVEDRDCPSCRGRQYTKQFVSCYVCLGAGDYVSTFWIYPGLEHVGPP